MHKTLVNGTEPPSQYFVCPLFGTITLCKRFFIEQANFWVVAGWSSDPKMLNLLSSVNITFCQNSSGSTTYFWAYSSHFLIYLAEMIGFFRATQPRYPFAWITLRTVCGLTLTFAYRDRLSASLGALTFAPQAFTVILEINDQLSDCNRNFGVRSSHFFLNTHWILLNWV